MLKSILTLITIPTLLFTMPHDCHLSAGLTQQQRGTEVVSLRDFGAVGDGITDDTVAIIAAVATGKTVYIPDGIFLTNEIGVATTGQTITGTGILKLNNARNSNVIRINANNITIEGITIDGNRSFQTLKENSSISGSGNGIYLADSIAATTVRNCYIHNTSLSGIAGWGNHLSCSYTQNRIENTGYNGIFPSFASNRHFSYGVISNNRIMSPGQLYPVSGGGDGIGTVGMRHTIISGNVIYNPMFAGIALEADNAFVSVVGNEIDGNSIFTKLSGGSPIFSKLTKGIQINDAFNITVTGNTVRRCSGGIVVSGGPYGKNVTVTSNVIESCSDGILIDASSIGLMFNTIVSSNIISNTWGRPIYIFKQCSTIVSGNVIEGVNLSNATLNPYRYGIVIGQGAAQTMVINNIISKDSNGRTPGQFSTGFMGVGIGEVIFAGTGTQQNVIADNFVTGATFFDTITLDRTFFTGGNPDSVTRCTKSLNGTFTSAPKLGAWKNSDVSMRKVALNSGYIGDVCTSPGQFLILSNLVASGKAGAWSISFNDGTQLYDGMIISIAGAGTAGAPFVVGIYSVNPVAKSAGISAPIITSVTNAVVTGVPPIFKAFGAITP